VPLLAVVKAASLGWLLGAAGLSLAALLWVLLRPRLNPAQRADASTIIFCGALLANFTLAALIWIGVISRHILMTTSYFHGLMYGGWSLGITLAGSLALLASLLLAAYGWGRARAHSRLSYVPLGNESGLPLVATGRVGTAALVGVWRPVLWVNPAYWAGLSTAQRGMLLLHERVHLARRDNLRKLVLGFIGSLYAVLPWLRRQPRLYELDCELAVDAACRRQLEQEEYREMLQLAAPQRGSDDAARPGRSWQDQVLRQRLAAFTMPIGSGNAWHSAPLALAIVAASAVPGGVLLGSPTLRCLLACYLGY
jgi:hypothetical protein